MREAVSVVNVERDRNNSAKRAGDRTGVRQDRNETSAGRVLLAATPIGNPADASSRLKESLENAGIIAAEDTRRLRHLCVKLEVRPTGKIVSLFEHNEQNKAAELVAEAAQGAEVLVVSDAGTPMVSDPGFRLVQQAIAMGVTVTALPGPSAALAALSLSGLPTDRFAFEGFLPRTKGEVQKRLQQAKTDTHTLIFFESPRRITQTLELMRDIFGEKRQAAICRELTKTYEEILRGTLGELVELVANREILGEITIVVQGASPASVEVASLVPQVVTFAQTEGIRLKDAAAKIAAQNNVSKNDLYRLALERNNLSN